MACHVCGNSAIGLCQQCYKFYCREHGDRFCTSCQEKGWQFEQNVQVYGVDTELVMQVAQSSATESTSGPIEDAEAESKTANTEVQPGVEEASTVETGAQEHAKSQRRWLDQERLEQITDPAKLISLLPIFGASKVNDVLVLLKGVELYEEAFGFGVDIVFGASADSNTMSHRHYDIDGLVVRDDAGTTYTPYQYGGSGNERMWTQTYLVMPPLNPEAKQLTLEIARLNIMEHIFRRRGHRSEPTRTLLNGPWTITCAIAGRDEGISLR